MLHAILKKVIVLPLDTKPKAVSGIIMPDTMEEKYPTKGTITSVGGDVTCGVKIGDIVQFKKFEAQEVKHEGKLYLIMEEENLIGIIND